MKRKNLLFVLVVVSCLSIFIGGWTLPPSLKKLPIEKNEFFIQTDTGMTIYTVEKKLKPAIPQKVKKPVLLIHGSGVGYGYWDIEIKDYSMMEFLARLGFDVYAVDQRGFGKSTIPNGLTVRGEESAEDLKSVIDFIKTRTKLAKVDIVGHSWGAVVATFLAGKYPEDIGKVVLMGSIYKSINPAFQGAVNFLIMQAKLGVQYLPNTHYLTVENSLYSYEGIVIDYYKTMVSQSYSYIPTGPFLDLEFFEYSDYIPQIENPTLLINGMFEYVVDREDAFNCLEDLAAIEKDLLTMGNAYHLVALEEVAHTRLNLAVATWLLKQ